MSHATSIETLLSASRVDIDDREQLSASCEVHAVAEHQLRAMIDAFRPLSDSIAVFLTR